MPSAVWTRGSKWSEAEMRQGWGDNITEDEITENVGDVVELFEQIASEAGFPCRWHPKTSEVIGEAGMGPWESVLDEWHDQANEVVWEQFIA